MAVESGMGLTSARGNNNASDILEHCIVQERLSKRAIVQEREIVQVKDCPREGLFESEIV